MRWKLIPFVVKASLG